MSECNCAVMRIVAVDKSITVESSHIMDREYTDTANKIGTSVVATVAARYGIPFYVCGPMSTIDASIATGADIPIEERKPEEVTSMWYERPMAPSGIKVFNPAFDVTDHELITAIITEKGIYYPPYSF